MKKIIALTVALTVIISILNISVFAETSTGGIENGGGGTGGNRGMSHQEYKTAMAYLIDDYANGKITVQEFSDRELAVTNEYLEYHKGIGENSYALAVTMGNHMNGIVQKVNTSVQQWGEEARDKVSEWWNGVTSNVPTETTQTSTSNLYGNGVFVKRSRNGLFDEYRCQAYGADYLVIDTSRGLDDVRICYYMNDNSSYTGYLFYDGSYHWNSSYTSGNFHGIYKLVGNTLTDSSGNTYKLYGDVRYIDGTPAPTDDEFEYGTIKKFDEMPAPDLDNVLNNFSEEMERQNPDLSSIEGLLNAIYARMGKLDSDNDNQLLSAINANILALLEADNNNSDKEDKTNEELVKTLLEIRDGLKDGTLGTSPEAHGHDISGTVYNVKPLDKNWFNNLLHGDQNLKVEYEGSTYYLQDCGCLKLGDKYYTPNMNYETVDLIDFDFSSDDSDLDLVVKFKDNKDYSEIRGNLGTLRDLLPNNNTRIKSRARGGISSYSLNGENNFFDDIFSHSQQRKIDKVAGYIEDFIAIGVPYESIQENLSTYESIIFDNGYTPKDLEFTIFGEKCTLLSYQAITSSDPTWENTSEYTNSLDIVKAFTSILISFCWVLSMYKKLSNLI